MRLSTTLRAGLLGFCLAGPTVPLAAQVQPDFRKEAFAAAEAGDFTKGAELFMKLYTAGAADRDALMQGATCLEKVGRYNDALDLLSRGKKKFPQEATFRVGLARVFNLQAAALLRSTGKMDTNVVFNYQDAIREGEELLETDPNNRDARLIVANSFYSLGEWDKVRPHAQELVQRFPEHPGGHIIMGDLAFEHYKLMRRRVGDGSADTSKESMQKLVGAREAARQSFTKAIQLDVKRGAAHRKLGDVLAWNGETQKALEKYGHALLLDPNAPVPHSWISTNTTPEAARKFYEDLGKKYLGAGQDPSKAAIFAWYGAAAAIAEKKYEEGELLYTTAVQLNPAYRQAYYYAMYSAYFYRKDEVAAMRHAAAYAKAAPIEFSDTVRAVADEHREPITRLVTYLAKKAMDTGQAAVSRDLNHVLAGIVDTADAWNNFAFMARESGLYDESEKAYRHALELQPGSGQLMNDLGVILHFHRTDPKAWDEAEQLYLKAQKAAERVLRDKKAGPTERETARVTKRDAKNNLRDLRARKKAAAGKK